MYVYINFIKESLAQTNIFIFALFIFIPFAEDISFILQFDIRPKIKLLIITYNLKNDLFGRDCYPLQLTIDLSIARKRVFERVSYRNQTIDTMVLRTARQ